MYFCKIYYAKHLKIMNYYIASVSDFIGDADVVTWLTSKVQLIVDDKVHKDDFVRKIKDQLSTLRKNLTIVVETEYVDAVYRDCYYSYFATKLKSCRRFCARISFFEPVFTSIDEFFSLDESVVKENYLGFMVIRPLGQCIGRNAISPIAKNAPIDTIKICKAEINATCLGLKLKVNAFPHASQDTEFMTCAETTAWALAEYFGNKYALYKPLMPSSLIATLQANAVERLVPSQGLTIQQISMALNKEGFGCKLYSKDYQQFKEIFTCYVESGLPLAVAVSGAGIGHAIVCVGRNSIERKHITSMKTVLGVDYYVWNDSIEDFIFNDDNMPCYQNYSFSAPTPYFKKNLEITQFIVPLHKKIYMTAEQAFDISNYFVVHDFKAPKGSVIRTFLTSSRSYREYICKNKDLSPQLKIAYLGIDLPKFIWVTEVANRTDFDLGKVNAIILLDATSNLTARDPYASLIFKQNANNITIYDKKQRILQNLFVNLPTCFESFNGNLT